MNKGTMSVVQVVSLVPPDLAGKLTAAMQIYESQYSCVENYDLIFRYNDKYDIVFNTDYIGLAKEEIEKLMESVSYTFYLISQIERHSPVLFPFVTNAADEIGGDIEQSECFSDSNLSKLQKDNMVWALRKELEIEKRAWFLEETNRCVRVYLTGEPKYDRVFFISIPYTCPPRFYLSIVRNLDRWLELVRLWSDTSDGAIGLIEHNPEEIAERIHKYHGYRFIDNPVPTPTEMSLEDFREKGYMTLEEFINRVSKFI